MLLVLSWFLLQCIGSHCSRISVWQIYFLGTSIEGNIRYTPNFGTSWISLSMEELSPEIHNLSIHYLAILIIVLEPVKKLHRCNAQWAGKHWLLFFLLFTCHILFFLPSSSPLFLFLSCHPLHKIRMLVMSFIVHQFSCCPYFLCPQPNSLVWSWIHHLSLAPLCCHRCDILSAPMILRPCLSSSFLHLKWSMVDVLHHATRCSPH